MRQPLLTINCEECGRKGAIPWPLGLRPTFYRCRACTAVHRIAAGQVAMIGASASDVPFWERFRLDLEADAPAGMARVIWYGTGRAGQPVLVPVVVANEALVLKTLARGFTIVLTDAGMSEYLSLKSSIFALVEPFLSGTGDLGNARPPISKVGSPAAVPGKVAQTSSQAISGLSSLLGKFIPWRTHG